MTALAAILLAGGRGSRLGGRDKAAIELGGERLVDRVAAAARAAGAAPIVVVGPDTSAPSGCVAAREDPPFGGPLAALAAALPALRRAVVGAGAETATGAGAAAPEWLLLLSCDLVDPRGAVALLTGAEALAAASPAVPAAPGMPAVEAVVLRDPDGREQWLAGRYRVASLEAEVAALGGDVDGAPLRRALLGLETRFVDAPADAVVDIDTPADLAAAELAVAGWGEREDPDPAPTGDSARAHDEEDS